MLKKNLLLQASLEAEKSPVKIATHGALIVLRNKIIAKGYNNYNPFSYGTYSTHAEVQAINNALMKVHKDKLKSAKLVVVRLTKEGCLSNSFPCESCQRYIKRFGINVVYYSS